MLNIAVSEIVLNEASIRALIRRQTRKHGVERRIHRNKLLSQLPIFPQSQLRLTTSFQKSVRHPSPEPPDKPLSAAASDVQTPLSIMVSVSRAYTARKTRSSVTSGSRSSHLSEYSDTNPALYGTPPIPPSDRPKQEHRAEAS